MSRERRVSLIAAMAENRVIGVDNALPWRLPADLRHFRRLTTGHHVIMGRRNYESIGKPLPDRTNIVVTRNPAYHAPGCLVSHSLRQTLQDIQDDPEVFVIGGAEIYRQALGDADRIYLTLVHANIAGDTYFPEFDLREWQEISRTRHEPDENNPYPYSFVTYDRKIMK
ncbi:MAG: dihydrofolate reductase [Gammaproteobacteria bacterium]|nr:dihydrofolate reductase [Gammaproteobacteria bacterium]